MSVDSCVEALSIGARKLLDKEPCQGTGKCAESAVNLITAPRNTMIFPIATPTTRQTTGLPQQSSLDG